MNNFSGINLMIQMCPKLLKPKFYSHQPIFYFIEKIDLCFNFILISKYKYNY